MVLVNDQNLTTQYIGLSLARLHSTGVAPPTAPTGGAPTLCSFDATDSVSTDVTVTTALINSINVNTRLNLNTVGEYEYGFGMRFIHSGTATGGDNYLYVLLNGTTQILGEAVKAVISGTGIVYVASCQDLRAFNQGDYLEVWMNNNMGVSVLEDAAGEQIYFYAKRTVGP